MKSVIIIPARLASTRLPRKLLLKETGKSVLQHTYESASSSQKADRVIVAADDEEIEADVKSFGGNVVMTRPDHVCGTDRVAEVAQSLDAEIIVNVQGDEPEISANAIDLAISMLEKNLEVPMATLATPIRDPNLLQDPSCVKVVFNRLGQAMYFSRSLIPHPRTWSDEVLKSDPANFFQHVGLYGYRRGFLLKIPELAVPEVEKIESLEQLRVLYSGNAIQVGLIDHPIAGIDTAEDYASFVIRHSS
ncbi:MAG: 3-deoxy-manno-octulosonate cytidylyltransferase [Mariniblastus sp.]